MRVLMIVVLGVVLAGFLIVSGVTNQQNRTLNTTSNKISSLPPTVSDLTSKKSLQLETIPFGGGLACTPDKIAVDFLIDVSGSMEEANNKFSKMKNAVSEILKNLKDESVVGFQTFGADELSKPVVNPDLLKNNRSQALSALNSLKAKGGTPTSRGLKLALPAIKTANSKFPDHKWVFVLLTDGCPNREEKLNTIYDLADQIKNVGKKVQVVTVSIDLGSDEKCDNWGGKAGAKEIMEKIASSKDDYHDESADSLSQLNNKIFKNLCTSQHTVSTLTCANGKKIAYDFLLDMSNSTQDSKGGRLTAMKAAMKDFKSELKDDDVIGVEYFEHKVATLIPINSFGAIKSNFDSEINKLDAGGPTRLKSAFEHGKAQIDAKKGGFPDHNFYMVLVSDGSYGERPNENPVQVATAIRNEGITIVGMWLEKEKLESGEREIADTVMPNTVSPGFLYDANNSTLSQKLKEMHQKACGT